MDLCFQNTEKKNPLIINAWNMITWNTNIGYNKIWVSYLPSCYKKIVKLDKI